MIFVCLLISSSIERGVRKSSWFFLYIIIHFIFTIFFKCTLSILLILLSPCHKSLWKKNTRLIWIQTQGLKYVMQALYPLSNEPLQCTSIIFYSSSSKFFPRLNSYREKYASKAEKIAEGAFSTFGPKCFILRKKIMT